MKLMWMSGVAALAALVLTAPVHAEPWLCTDEYGNKGFNYDAESARKKNCVHHPIPSGNVIRARPRVEREATQASAASPASFPRVDEKTQRQRDATRREILERELAEEKKSLANAMQQLDEQQRALAMVGSNVKVEERLRPIRDRVRIHLTNISNLEKELDRDS